MSKYYTAIVTNESEGISFKVLVKAESIAQARSGSASHLIYVDRATDQEIFEAGQRGLFVLNLSDLPTDGVHPDQQPLINEAPTPDSGDQLRVQGLVSGGHLGTFGAGEAVECGGSAPPVLVGATASGSAPAWLPQSDRVAQNTGD